MKVWSLPLLALLALPVACKRSGNRTVYADVPVAGSLKEGAPVKFRGIDIGLVRKLTLLRSGVRLELLIQRPDAPLQINDRVAVRPTGTFGDEVVEIVPGPASGPPLRDRDSLQSVPPDSLAAVRDALTRAIAHQLSERWGRTDSTKPGKTAAPPSRP